MYETLDTQLIEQAVKWMDFKSFIQSERIVEFVERAYRECVPMTYFIQPASMTGKYHPSYSQGVGGLLRHVKATLILAKGLLPLQAFTPLEADYTLAALSLHDTGKPDKLHPLKVKALLEPIQDDYYGEIEKVVPLIETHMGQWDYHGKLPRPKTAMQHFVHLCDYLSSREYITVEINSMEDRK